MRLYSTRESALTHSPSIDSFSTNSSIGRKSTFTLGRKSTFSLFHSGGGKKNSQPSFMRELSFSNRTPASPESLGQFIGEFSLIIPSDHAFSKVTGKHQFLLNEKEVGKASLQIGIFHDRFFEPRPVKQTIDQENACWATFAFGLSEFQRFNTWWACKVQLMKIWVKQVVVANHDSLLIYNEAYNSKVDDI